ncbi:MAG: hypothetical protein ACI8QZ_001112 [Chlamydiales bacterium]|jgi:hypothetical protein
MHANSHIMSRVLTSTALIALLPATGLALPVGDWVSFTKETGRLGVPSNAVSNGSTEIDFAWADLDQDGWTDLVVVRKEPVTSAGKRTNILLMNDCGILRDETAAFASASLTPGDNGFMTPTNDRDVTIADLDNDGWLDFVTATTLSDSDSKLIGHPRVYMNLGNDGSGAWLGMRHEDARIPQLLVGGVPTNPRFCSVAIGDLTDDGFADLYFGDYDSGPQPHADMNDRLLINDGTGNFTDESNMRMSAVMLQSAFGMASIIEDMNLDGYNDVVKDTALNAPQLVRAIYNDPGNPGFFSIFEDFHAEQPYHTNVGDLNNDGRPDLVMTDDAADRYRYNLATDGLGRVDWGPAKTFQFEGGGGDDGFGGNNLIVDLDLDGWEDVIIADVDVDIAGCSRRTHIYHNPAGAIGSQITLIEQRGPAGDPWRGVGGMVPSDLTGTHDVAVFDVNNDGFPDMVFGRCIGTFVWMNDLGGVDGFAPYCSSNLNSAGTRGTLRATGSSSVSANDLVLQVEGARPDGFGIFFFGPGQVQVTFGDGIRCVGGMTQRINPAIQANASGAASRAVDNTQSQYAGQLAPGNTWNFQHWYRDPGGPLGTGFNLSDGLTISFCD